MNIDDINVLSTFDGISCGKVALERAGIPLKKYFASEIEPHAEGVSKYNHPDIVRLGDINNFKSWDLPKIDLLIGGFPCQDLSIAKANRKGLDGARSGLFFKYVDCLEKFSPRYFLVENNASMKKEDKDTITEILGVDPIMINSALVSAQSRKRLYWTNIPIKPIPSENLEVLKDIMENNVPEKYFYKKNFSEPDMSKKVCSLLDVNTFEMNKRIYNPNFKCCTLTCISGGWHEKKIMDNGRPRKLTEIEYERLQGLPDNFTNVELNGKKLSYTKRCSLCGNGWTLPVIKHILSGLKGE